MNNFRFDVNLKLFSKSILFKMAHGSVSYPETKRESAWDFKPTGFGYQIAMEIKKDKKGKKTGEKLVFILFQRGFYLDIDTGGDSRSWWNRPIHSGTIQEYELPQIDEFREFIRTPQVGNLVLPTGLEIVFTEDTLKFTADTGEEMTFEKSSYYVE